MTKQQSERNEFIAKLRETLKPGDTLHTVLRGVSRSGMNRKIDVYLLTAENGKVEKQWLSYWIAKACGFTFDKKSECISVGGCGMDMGFHVVYETARRVFSEGFTCTGKDCPANDHTNAYGENAAGRCIVCRKDLAGSTWTRLNREGGSRYRVCSEACATGTWIHSDPGYALRQEWL
jgi:hypothetical protein